MKEKSSLTIFKVENAMCEVQANPISTLAQAGAAVILLMFDQVVCRQQRPQAALPA